MGNPYCSCKLTRVRIVGLPLLAAGAAAGGAAIRPDPGRESVSGGSIGSARHRAAADGSELTTATQFTFHVEGFLEKCFAAGPERRYTGFYVRINGPAVGEVTFGPPPPPSAAPLRQPCSLLLP